MQLGSLQYPRNPMNGASEHFRFLSVLAGGHGLVPPARACRAAGQCFSWPRRGFPLPAMNDRNALGFARRSSLAPCAQKLATTPALATHRLLLSIRLGRCLPIFATRHLLRWSLCARALLPLCFRCVRFVDLRWCGSWPLVAGLGGWD